MTAGIHVRKASPVGRAVDWALRSRSTGKITIVQKPNVALVLFVVLRIAEALLLPQGTASDVAHWVGVGALVWWALGELVAGVNPFRRVLGAAALAALVR